MKTTKQIITVDGVASPSSMATTQAKARTWLDNVERHWRTAGATAIERADADHLRVVTPSGAVITAINIPTKGAK